MQTYVVEIDGKPTNWCVRALTNPPGDDWAVGAIRHDSSIALVSPPRRGAPLEVARQFFRCCNVSGLTHATPGKARKL